MAMEEGSNDAMTFVITLLNLLGKQNEQNLKAANVSSISISAENISDVVLKVRYLLKDQSSISECSTGCGLGNVQCDHCQS